MISSVFFCAFLLYFLWSLCATPFPLLSQRLLLPASSSASVSTLCSALLEQYSVVVKLGNIERFQTSKEKEGKAKADWRTIS
jgi:hypothetical protein